MKYYPAIKMKKILPFETRMDRDSIVLNEISQTEWRLPEAGVGRRCCSKGTNIQL